MKKSDASNIKYKFNLGIEAEMVQFYRVAQNESALNSNRGLFYVLPYLPKNYADSLKTCYFPDLSLQIDLNDWVKLKKNNFYAYNSLASYKKIFSGLAEHMLPKSYKQKLVADFESKKQGFFEDFNKIFGKTEFPFSEIEINVISTGTFASYDYKDNKKLELYIRGDMAVDFIFELVLTGYLRRTYIDHKLNKIDYENFANINEWIETESISDFLMTETILNKYSKNFVPTLKIVTAINNEELFNESQAYREKLGFDTSVNSRILIDVNKNLCYNNKPIVGLTLHEKKVLMLLSDNINSTISYERIAEALWGQNYIEKFSLVYINKLIFSVRQKLKLNRLQNLKIDTLRSSGYILRKTN